MRSIEVIMFILAISALLCFAGYLIGKMVKKTALVIVLLIPLCSIPSVLMLGAIRTNPLAAAQKGAVLQGLAVWGALNTLLVLAGYLLSRRRSLGIAVASVLFLLELTGCGIRWLDQTRWLDSIRWHQTYGDRVRIGSWEFVIPGAWYGKPVSVAVVDIWEHLGISEYVSLQRRSLSTTRERASIEILTPARTVTSSREETNGLTLDPNFQIQGESGMCSLTRLENTELRFRERCMFPIGDLRVNIEGRSEDDLHEAEHILSGGQIVKTSNPHAVRLPS